MHGHESSKILTSIDPRGNHLSVLYYQAVILDAITVCCCCDYLYFLAFLKIVGSYRPLSIPSL